MFSGFELALNTGKTKLLSLPVPLELLGIRTLRNFTFRTKSNFEEAEDIQLYFDRLFELHATYPDEHFINYGIARLRNLRVQGKNWPLFESLLLLCIAPEPACLPYVLEIVTTSSNAGEPINKEGIEAILNTLIIEHSVFGHSSEVAWALWGCLALRLPIHSDAVTILQSSEDSTAILLALDCEQQGLTITPIDKTLWEGLMTESSLYDEHWLFAYEANKKGWLRGTGKKDFVSTDRNFGFLKANGVFFYDELRTASQPGQPVPIPKPPAASLTLPDDFEGYGLTFI